jgi:DNA-3-methyladenine glycosylase
MVARDFFERDAVDVAPQLLGAVVRHHTADGVVAVRISEVEAYRGSGEDPGSHAHRGPTRRNRVMFGEPGHVYTYFTYGMHVCANLVCSPEGQASGVLLRGGTVVEGIELARHRRPSARSDRDLARGPARLASALGIRLDEGGSDALGGSFSVTLPEHPSPYVATARTGVSGAGGGDAYPWRFHIPGDEGVSPYRRHRDAHD